MCQHAHLLVDRCLNEMIASELIQDQPQLKELIENATLDVNSILKGESSKEKLADHLKTLASAVEEKEIELSSKSKTA